MLPVVEPVVVNAKSEASTPLTCSLKVARKTTGPPLMVAPEGFWRLMERTVGGVSSTVTTKSGEERLSWFELSVAFALKV